MIHSRSPIAVPWYREESYEKIRNIPGCDLSDDFDDWEIRAQRSFTVLRTSGLPIVRVLVEPDDIALYVKETGTTQISSTTRALIANDKLAKSEVLPVLEVLVECPSCRASYSFPGGVLTVAAGVEIGCHCGMALQGMTGTPDSLCGRD